MKTKLLCLTLLLAATTTFADPTGLITRPDAAPVLVPDVTARALPPVDQAPCPRGQAWTGTITCDKGTRSAGARVFPGNPGVEVCMIGYFSCQPLPGGVESVQDYGNVQLGMMIWNYEQLLR